MKEDIIVFGRGAYCQAKKTAINDEFHIVAYIDNNAGQEETEDGVPVYRPEAVEKMSPYRIVILSSRRYFLAMALQLKTLGIQSNRILFGINMRPDFDAGERLIHDLHGTVQIEEKQAVLKCDAGEYRFSTEAEYQSVIRKLSQGRDSWVKMLADLPCQPMSRRFGAERGKPIDRYYIESFLDTHGDLIYGDVLEIADTTYTKRYGKGVTHSRSLHVANWGGIDDHIQGNLETGSGIPTDAFDCLICTQTIQMIYDIHSVMKNIYRLLKPGGAALITAHGISQISMSDYKNWGEYWRFTKQSMEKLLWEAFAPENVTVQAWGNVKTAMCFLYGLCQEDLMEEDFAYNDEQYPLIITAVCRKM